MTFQAHRSKTDLMENKRLISHTAQEACQSGDYEICDALLARYEAQCPLPTELLILRGRSLMGQGRLDEAVHALEMAAASGRDSQSPTSSPMLMRS
ncbi:hypothetical protein [Dyella sp. GSA-30]|uniref:hypothetical protein n=1 Tax=Dyella sp. GSA-30 TaxID=2994496 RepID=UPI00248F8407|nr:hypothetical protein [Dyella sp. GSA-30]BDU21377.1 hypothetical protein DYGSA30_28340 [Dyella sp. GSA-30]